MWMLADFIHHSDRGVQYASYDYTGILKKHGIKISMTERGDTKNNVVAERVNGTLFSVTILSDQWLPERRETMHAAPCLCTIC